MPVEGGSITGNAILGFRGIILIQSLKCHIESNGRMRLTRMATPTNMRAIASEFTGKPYARSRKGLEQALADMLQLQTGKSLDELGETAVVNHEVGGVAADLQ